MVQTNFNFSDKIDTNGIVVDIPSNIQAKKVLLEILGTGLQFPDYYGVNWDALEECIRDLSWLKEDNVIIRHTDLPLTNDDAHKIYLAILKDAVGKWKKEPLHNLIIVFPPELQMKIESLID